MNFRLIWMGPEEDPDGHPPARTGAAAAPRLASGAVHYEQRGAEMVRWEQLDNGRVKYTRLANFSARIVRDIVLDDDAELRRLFGVEAECGGNQLAFEVPAAEFGRMSWVLDQLGPQAILYPGQQQHARVAIQSLSGPIRQERIFSHVGWRKYGSEWVYLHAGGAVGAGAVPGEVRVQLPAALQHYQIPSLDGDERVRAVRASLHLLSVAPERISLPLLAAVYRAALGQVDFSVFVVGPTGVFKTALAALCQQHFGAAMDARHLPANFASTANAVEVLAFLAKDALLVAITYLTFLEAWRILDLWKAQPLLETQSSGLPTSSIAANS